MRTYSSVAMKVDGNETAKLDIFHEHNLYHVYEHDENVFTGSYTGTINYIEDWKAGWEQVKNFLEASNHTVVYESTIR